MKAFKRRVTAESELIENMYNLKHEQRTPNFINFVVPVALDTICTMQCNVDDSKVNNSE